MTPRAADAWVAALLAVAWLWTAAILTTPLPPKPVRWDDYTRPVITSTP